MDTIRKLTHLDPDVMLELLRMIGPAHIRTAIKAWARGDRPKNAHKFRPARKWAVWDKVGGVIPHRPLIALACELCDEREMNPNNFGLDNDGICRNWFESERFTIVPIK